MSETAETEIPLSRRIDLLPIWIKVFTWLFLIMALITPLALAFGMLGLSFNLELYGLATQQPLSLVGFVIMGMISFKGMVAYGLLSSRTWAVSMAKADAMFGIGFCMAMMLASLYHYAQGMLGFSLRLELVILIPYFLAMDRLESPWKKSR